MGDILLLYSRIYAWQKVKCVPLIQKKRKEAEEARYQKYPNFQAKGLLPDRTLESFMLKSTDGATPKL